MNPLLSKAGPTDPVWTAYQGGRHIELDVERDGERVRLWIDGEQAVVYDEPLEQFRIGRSEVLVEVEIRSEAIKRAELVLGDERVALTPSGKDENRERSSGLVAKHGVEDRPDPGSEPVPSPSTSWTGDYGGRRVVVDANEEVEHVRLWVDGREVAVIGGEVGRLRFGTGDVLVEARVRFSGTIKRAEIVNDGERLPLDPPAETKEGRRELRRRARLQAWRRSRFYGWILRGRERHRLAEDSPWRHLSRGLLQVVVPLLVVTLLFRLFRLLPNIDVPLPSISLPLPTFPSPSLPTVSVPDWLQWVVDRSQYVVPILIGLFLSLVELRRRRRGERDPSAPNTKIQRLARVFLGRGRDRG